MQIRAQIKQVEFQISHAIRKENEIRDKFSSLDIRYYTLKGYRKGMSHMITALWFVWKAEVTPYITVT